MNGRRRRTGRGDRRAAAHPSRGLRGFSERAARSAAAAAVLLPLVGCHRDHVQSMLHPASGASAEIAWLWWFLCATCTTVFVIVMVLAAIAVFGRPRAHWTKSPVGNGFIVVSGIIVPALILVVILLASLRSEAALRMPEAELTVRVVGHQWWWQVEYPDEGIVTANEIYIPAGEPVRLELRAADVIHSFWVPNLNGKTDLLPDKTNVAWIAADRPGAYRGQCAEYCGAQHALMGFEVVALPREEFDAWVAERRQAVAERANDPPPVIAPADAAADADAAGAAASAAAADEGAPGRADVDAVQPADSDAAEEADSEAAEESGTADAADDPVARGRQVFFDAACNNCHTIRGTPAVGERGPDLTHLGSRRTLGAGWLRNNHGNLAGWISNPQALKPGNRMPPTHLESNELHDLIAYLMSLQ